MMLIWIMISNMLKKFLRSYSGLSLMRLNGLIVLLNWYFFKIKVNFLKATYHNESINDEIIGFPAFIDLGRLLVCRASKF